MHESKSLLMTCAGQSSTAWRLLIRPNGERKNTCDSHHVKYSRVLLAAGLNERTQNNLFKLLLDVSVRLQFELSARVRPVNQEQPLLGVHLFDEDRCFLVVPHLDTNKHFILTISVPFFYYWQHLCGSMFILVIN